jgi:hypothetical protein
MNAATHGNRQRPLPVRITPIVLGLVLASWPAGSPASTYVVHPDGSGDFPTIQQALDAAVDGDDIVLTDGTFHEAGDLDFHGRSLVLRSASGDPHTCVLDPVGRGFNLHSGETRAARIEGITVYEGQAHDDSEQGGGARIWNASPTFSNCIFDNCCAIYGNAVFTDGGAPLLQDCDFHCGCVAIPDGRGGAIFAYNSNVTVEDSRFFWNGETSAGTVYAEASDLTFSRCTFGAIIGLDECFYLDGGTTRFFHCSVALASGDALFRLVGDATLIADHSIFANGNESMVSVICSAASTAQFSCCDVFGFLGGNWVNCLAGQQELSGNLSQDPHFCEPMDALAGLERRLCNLPDIDLSLRTDSPCAEENNPDCGLIGAHGVACDGPVPVEATSWGWIKERFRSR